MGYTATELRLLSESYLESYGTLSQAKKDFGPTGHRVASSRDLAFLDILHGLKEGSGLATSESWIYHGRKVFLTKVPLTIEELEEAERFNRHGREYFLREEQFARLLQGSIETGFLGYIQTGNFERDKLPKYLFEDLRKDYKKSLRERDVSTIFIHLHRDTLYENPFIRPFSFIPHETFPLIMGNGSFNQNYRILGIKN